MISLKIIDTKDFMSKLLISDNFNKFLLSEAVISTYNTFTIDGHINETFFSSDELAENNFEAHGNISYWETVKPICFNLIKGKKTPLSFKIVFLLAPANFQELLDQVSISLNAHDINNLVLNINFKNNSLTCTTATSVNVFTLDKTLDNEWDSMVKKYLKANEIAFEEL